MYLLPFNRSLGLVVQSARFPGLAPHPPWFLGFQTILLALASVALPVALPPPLWFLSTCLGLGGS